MPPKKKQREASDENQARSKRPYKEVTPEIRKEVLKRHKKGESLNEISKDPALGISRATVQNIWNKRHKKHVGHPNRLKVKKELQIVEFLTKKCKSGFPCLSNDPKLFVQTHVDSQWKPSPKWLTLFKKRHHKKLCKSPCPNKRLGKTSVDKYINDLKKQLKDIQTDNIINYGITHIIKDGCGNPDVVMTKPKRRSDVKASIMFAVTANGNVLSPHVVLKEGLDKSLLKAKVKKKGATYSTSKSGKFDHQHFLRWFKSKVLKRWNQAQKKRRVCLGTNFSTYFSPKLFRLCEKNKIKFRCFPRTPTSVNCPLWDLKNDLKRNELPTRQKKSAIANIVLELLEQFRGEKSKEKIKLKFQEAGIYPFSKKKIRKRF